jgi:hypothetical protein
LPFEMKLNLVIQSLCDPVATEQSLQPKPQSPESAPRNCQRIIDRSFELLSRTAAKLHFRRQIRVEQRRAPV